MALSIQLDEGRSFTKTLRLSGRLDNQTAADLDRELDKVLATPMKAGSSTPRAPASGRSCAPRRAWASAGARRSS
jgi:hypothetical protein